MKMLDTNIAVPTRKLYQLALWSSPFIGLGMVMPLFILMPVSVELPMRVEWILAAAMCIAMIFWTLHIEAMRWLPVLRKPFLRFAAVGLVMMLFSMLMMRLVVERQGLPIPIWKAHMLRLLNVISLDGVVALLSNTLMLAYDRKRLSDENEQLKFVNLEFKYARLKAQINPHFLFNAIGTAKPLIKKNPALAETYLVRLSRFLRSAIVEERDLVSLNEELGLVADFVEMQRLRFGEALQVDMDIDEQFLGRRVPHFAIITLIENAIKHNAMSLAEPLHIALTVKDNWIWVRNSRRPKFVLEPSTKTGLANLEQRYNLLSKEKLQVEATEAEFAVGMRLL